MEVRKSSSGPKTLTELSSGFTEWLAAGPLELMTWSSNVVGSSSFHQIQRNSIQSLVENKDRAEDIISVIATQSVRFK